MASNNLIVVFVQYIHLPMHNVYVEVSDKCCKEARGTFLDGFDYCAE